MNPWLLLSLALPGQPANLDLPGARPLVIERRTYDWPPPDRMPHLEPIPMAELERLALTGWLLQRYMPPAGRR